MLALQASVGNRAVQLLMRQAKPPSGKQIANLWERLWTKEMIDQECTAVARGMAKELGGVTRDAGVPVIRFTQHDKKASAKEVAEAHSRGKEKHKTKYFDKLLPNTDTLVIYTGSAAGKEPNRTEFQLLPGMLVYTAEDGGWLDKAAGTYRWYQRHMSMYAGGGKVYENWLDPHGARNLWELENQGVHPRENKFFSVLSIYDPFQEHRAALFKRQLKETFLDVKGGVEGTLETLIPWR